MPEAARAQLIRIETDRRLGHEWDQWDGTPLPNGGDFSAPPRAFFTWLALSLALAGAVVGGLIYLLAPRLALVWSALPGVLGWSLGALLVLAGAWVVLLVLSFYGGR